MLDEHKIRKFLQDFRTHVESSWTYETASPKLQPAKNDPASTGQCAPTSILLLDALKKEFGHELKLKIALGKVLHSGSNKVAIEYHVWLQLYANKYQAPFVIDTTADQGTGINDEIIFEQNTELVISKNLIYLSYNLFSNPSELSQGAQKRTELLRQNIASIDG